MSSGKLACLLINLWAYVIANEHAYERLERMKRERKREGGSERERVKERERGRERGRE